MGSGYYRRPIHENTSWDQARLEVSGHRFCDLSEGNFGAALLTDYKYGYTVRDQCVGITLLKAPKFPWDGTDMK
jgi:alpha-mannosidase